MSHHLDHHELEALFQHKIMLYYDLRECLQQEREFLIELDLNHLWEISRQKESLCRQLKSTRLSIMAALNRMDGETFPHLDEILTIIPNERRTKYQSMYHRLVRLKGDVEALRKENIHYVDDSLSFIDEMITVITGVSHNRETYDRRCQLKRLGNPLLLMREV